METKAVRKENVSLALIQPSTFNPRKTFDEAALKELSDSIASQGVLQQIGLRPIADTDRYEIIFGERRYRASVMAGLEAIRRALRKQTHTRAAWTAEDTMCSHWLCNSASPRHTYAPD